MHLRLASHRLALTDEDAAAKQALEAAFKAAGLQAGTLEETAASAGIKIDRARKLYNLLAAERRVQRIGDFVFHVDAIEDLKSRVQAQKSISPKIDIAVFKEITGGLTRKYAIPLLEFLDHERITRRSRQRARDSLKYRTHITPKPYSFALSSPLSVQDTESLFLFPGHAHLLRGISLFTTLISLPSSRGNKDCSK